MVRALEAGPERIPADDVAGQLRWLRLHRLLAVSPLLYRHGVISRQVDSLARELAAHKPAVSRAQLEEERRVFARLVDAGIPALALKGVRLAYTVYENPAQRARTDLDLLVAPRAIAQARSLIESLGYRPQFTIEGGTPKDQEAWLRDGADGQFMIDLHWKVRNHPCLKDRLGFEEQWEASIALPGLAEGARGHASGHALLNASMHWFDCIYADRYPVIWLLDKDLLWRDMDDAQREAVCALSIEKGLSALLGESLRLARELFDTPVADELIDELARAGRSRTPTRLIEMRNRRFRAPFFALSCEKGLHNKLRRLHQWVVPSAAHMRQRFPHGSRLGLLGLYWRRIRRRL
jgi:hypothetical protein